MVRGLGGQGSGIAVFPVVPGGDADTASSPEIQQDQLRIEVRDRVWWKGR
jgi:hypothetical protein